MKTKEILSIIILIALLLLFIPNMVNAETSTVTLESIEVTSPKSGTYETGEKITIVEKYTDTIIGDPEIKIKFGEGGDRKSLSGTINDNIITYEYTIENADSGELILLATSSYIKDKNNNFIAEPSELPTLGGSKISVNPITWTNIENIKVNVSKSDDPEFYNVYLKITDLEKKEGHDYYFFITEENTKPTIEVNETDNIINYSSLNEKYNNDKLIRFYNSLKLNENILITDFFEKNYNKLYLWIIEQQKNNATGKYEQKFIMESREINKPEQNKLGMRMQGYLSSKRTSTFLYEPHKDGTERNINIKIGKVADNSILLSIKNGEANCLEKLLAYAKKADSIYTGKVKLGRDNTITDKFEVLDDAYYYVYFELDDENGKYYPVEDVSLYQGLVGETVGKNLSDYLSEEFKWNIVEENKNDVEENKNDVEENKNEKPDTQIKDTTTAQGTIPQTGESITIFIVIGALVVVGTIGIVKFRKNNF